MVRRSQKTTIAATPPTANPIRQPNSCTCSVLSVVRMTSSVNWARRARLTRVTYWNDEKNPRRSVSPPLTCRWLRVPHSPPVAKPCTRRQTMRMIGAAIPMLDRDGTRAITSEHAAIDRDADGQCRATSAPIGESAEEPNRWGVMKGDGEDRVDVDRRILVRLVEELAFEIGGETPLDVDVVPLHEIAGGSPDGVPDGAAGLEFGWATGCASENCRSASRVGWFSIAVIAAIRSGRVSAGDRLERSAGHLSNGLQVDWSGIVAGDVDDVHVHGPILIQCGLDVLLKPGPSVSGRCAALRDDPTPSSADRP